MGGCGEAHGVEGRQALRREGNSRKRPTVLLFLKPASHLPQPRQSTELQAPTLLAMGPHSPVMTHCWSQGPTQSALPSAPVAHSVQ